MNRGLLWQLTTVKAIKEENVKVKTFTLALSEWNAHQAGQHYLLRLVAEDGYQTRRSYSVASEPERKGEIDLTIERLEEGEVSTYLHDHVKVGDHLEVRGPFGGYFIWKANYKSPLWLIAGGSGIVPLMAMLRHRKAQKAQVPVRLLYSLSHAEDLIYGAELQEMAAEDPLFDLTFTYTQTAPANWKGYQRRMDREMLEAEWKALNGNPLAYICGPTPMVEFAATTLLELGLPGVRIRTERFGASG